MLPEYKLYKGEGILIVKHTYLLKYVPKTLDEVIDEIEWVADNFETAFIDEPNRSRVVIVGKDDLTVMQVLLSFMEMQLLQTLEKDYFPDIIQ